jgi:hypothetical protein
MYVCAGPATAACPITSRPGRKRRCSVAQHPRGLGCPRAHVLLATWNSTCYTCLILHVHAAQLSSGLPAGLPAGLPVCLPLYGGITPS